MLAAADASVVTEAFELEGGSDAADSREGTMGKKNGNRNGMTMRGGFGPFIVHAAMDGGSEEEKALVEYLLAHDLLPKGEGWLGDAEVLQQSSLLSSPVATREVKKRAMILLAHSCNPMATSELCRHLATIEASLRHFAAFAIDEASQWTQPQDFVSTAFS
ncbi:MAG: hypothetical protein QM765_42475 [Myxococcales bacterium]